MATKLTQSVVDKIRHDQKVGKQIYDASVSGLRIVVGKNSASYKLVGRINDGTDRYISLLIGRTDEVSLKSARERAHELRTVLRRGEDPRAPKASPRSLPFVTRILKPKQRHWFLNLWVNIPQRQVLPCGRMRSGCWSQCGIVTVQPNSLGDG